jgi:hypothetical protein
LQQPPQQAAVGTHDQRAGHERQRQAFLPGQRRELDLELAQQFIHAETDEVQCAENLLDCFEGCVDVADQPAVLARALPLDQ